MTSQCTLHCVIRNLQIKSRSAFKDMNEKCLLIETQMPLKISSSFSCRLLFKCVSCQKKNKNLSGFSVNMSLSVFSSLSCG